MVSSGNGQNFFNFFLIVLAFITSSAVSWGLLAAIKFGLGFLGIHPFEVNGQEILLGAILLFVVFQDVMKI